MYIHNYIYVANSGLTLAIFLICELFMKKKETKKLRKKNSQLLIRINEEERDNFVALCDELDTSAAREIRKFIRQFVTDNTPSES
ncbi:MAG: hypothetical protein ACMZ64_09075 [Oleiphilus sp.]